MQKHDISNNFTKNPYTTEFKLNPANASEDYDENFGEHLL